MRAQERRAKMRRAREQFVHKRVLGLADRQVVEARHVEEAFRVMPAGMRRIEHQRRGQPARPNRLECRLVPVVGLH